MAGEDRAATAAVKDRLLREGASFSFFQALRLLRLLGRQRHPELSGRQLWRSIRVRPKLTMAFPETDLDAIEEAAEGEQVQVTANFYGLYGVSSPLPSFYTEDLLGEESHERKAAREFLDILHQALYPLLYEAWAKPRQALKVVEEGDGAYLDRLFALLGLGDRKTRESLPLAYALLRYTGLFTQFPRSALGLQTLLSDALEGMPVRIESCVLRRVRIPHDQQNRLGERAVSLGRDLCLGQQVDDRMSAIRIRVGPVSPDQFQRLLPQKLHLNWVRFLVRLYAIGTWHVKAEIVLAAGSVQAAQLGHLPWGHLGLDTWLVSGSDSREVAATFALYA